MTAIERAKHHSEETLSTLRNSLSDIGPPSEIVATSGSYARREASPESDLDFYVITSSIIDPNSPPPWLREAKRRISEIVVVEPAADGAFAESETAVSILRNVGGELDTNHKFTRRMLLLLEGEWLFNRSGFTSIRRQILQRYIAENITDHQLGLFLLNDIIRYYRTIAVDYEFKTIEGSPPKPWGIRNIKLVFSRKLLYASGLFSVAMTADRQRDAKISLLEGYLDVPVIERMTNICGAENFAPALACYERFLGQIEQPSVREHLKSLTRDQRTDPVFRDLKNDGHQFTRELLKLFEATFDSTHPIRRAVIF